MCHREYTPQQNVHCALVRRYLGKVSHVMASPAARDNCFYNVEIINYYLMISGDTM